MTLYNTLFASLPETVVVELQPGTHKGEGQPWANYRYEGVHYKLVVSYERRNNVTCHPGEVWELIPRHSPNGHVIFCKPRRKVEASEREHPFIRRARCFLEARGSVSILRHEDIRTRGWTRSGLILDVERDGENMVVTMLHTAVGKEFTFSCPLEWIVEDTETKKCFALFATKHFVGYTLRFSRPSYV